MKVIQKKPGEGPQVIDIRSIEDVYAELGSRAKKLEFASDVVILYDSAWRENGKCRNIPLCGAELGGTVYLVGVNEEGFTETHNIDGLLYAGFSSVRYRSVDRDNNVWQCRHCHYLQQFEADGPCENGWSYCPSCGAILVTPKLQEVTL